MLNFPSEEFLTGLGPQSFANEVELQRFVEDNVVTQCGLEVIGSSLRGGRRLGYIDTVALHTSGILVIVEYKWDMIDRDVLNQVVRYRQWLLKHRESIDAAVLRYTPGRRVNWVSIGIVTVGHRYHPSAVWRFGDTPFVCFLRYSYGTRGTISLEMIDPKKVRTAVVGARPPSVSKDPYLDRHLARTTPAAREAFDLLRRELLRCGFVEKIHGKKRVTYRTVHRSVEVRFTDVVLECVSAGVEKLPDPEGRGRVTRAKHGWRLTCGIVSPADVSYVTGLIAGAGSLPGASEDEQETATTI